MTFEFILQLKYLIILPFLASLVILFPAFPNDEVWIRRFAKSFCAVEFLYSILFLSCFDENKFQMSYEQVYKFFGFNWLESFGVTANVALDGLSMILVVLVCFVILIVTVLAKHYINTKPKLFYSLILLVETAIIGTLCAKDALLFFFFFQLEFLPVYFLLSIWSGDTAKQNANRFLAISYLASIFIFFSICILTYYNFKISGILTADMQNLNISEHIYPFWFQMFVFSSFLFGFLLRLPVWPFHTVFVTNIMKAPFPVGLLVAVSSQIIAIYGILRFNLGIFPEIFKISISLFMFISSIFFLIFILISSVQSDLKKVITYITLSLPYISIVSLCCINDIGLKNCILSLGSNSLTIILLFSFAAVIYIKTKTTDLKKLGALAQKLPNLYSFSFPVFFQSAYLPISIGSLCFILCLFALITVDYDLQFWPILTLFSLLSGFIVLLFALIKVFNKMFVETSRSSIQIESTKIGISETIVLFLSVSVSILLAVYPHGVFDFINTYCSIITDLIKI